MQKHKTNHGIPTDIEESHISYGQLDVDNACSAWDNQTDPPDFSFSVCNPHTPGLLRRLWDWTAVIPRVSSSSGRDITPQKWAVRTVWLRAAHSPVQSLQAPPALLTGMKDAHGKQDYAFKIKKRVKHAGLRSPGLPLPALQVQGAPRRTVSTPNSRVFPAREAPAGQPRASAAPQRSAPDRGDSRVVHVFPGIITSAKDTQRAIGSQS